MYPFTPKNNDPIKDVKQVHYDSHDDGELQYLNDVVCSF